MSKEAYYFSHDCNAREDEKILELRMDHDWYGYGIYWAIVEMLRDANDYTLQLNCKRIAFALKTDEKIIQSILKDYGLFSFNETHFWSDSLKNRMAIKEAKSKKAREAALKRWGKKEEIEVIDIEEVNTNALQTQSEPNAIKGKEKKRKEIYIYYKSEIDFLNDWKKAREAILRKPTNIKKLARDELLNFQSIKNEFSITEFQEAMQGLFKQKDIFDSNILRPRHFLENRNIEKYLDAFKNNTQLYEKKKVRL